MADTATRLTNDAASDGVDYYVTEDERCNTNEDERCSTNEDKRSSEQRNESDVAENVTRPRPASSRDLSFPHNELPCGTENENDVTDDLESREIASNGGADITVPGIPNNEKSEEN